MKPHTITREGDENACSCGLRWGVGERDPHTTASWGPGVITEPKFRKAQRDTNRTARRILDQLKQDLKQ